MTIQLWHSYVVCMVSTSVYVQDVQTHTPTYTISPTEVDLFPQQTQHSFIREKKKRKEIKWCTPLSLALSLSFSLSLQTKVMFSLLRVRCDYDNVICFKLWKDQLCTDVTAVIWKIFSLVCVKEEILHTSVIGMHILEIEVFQLMILVMMCLDAMWAEMVIDSPN